MLGIMYEFMANFVIRITGAREVGVEGIWGGCGDERYEIMRFAIHGIRVK